jgi:hypothetical protein
VVLHGPQGVEAEPVGEHPEMHLLGDDLPVGHVRAVAVGLEDHLTPTFILASCLAVDPDLAEG